MIQSPELQAKVAAWRQKVRDKTITREELREAVAALRQARGAAPQATSGSRAKKAGAAKPNGEDLLNELGSL